MNFTYRRKLMISLKTKREIISYKGYGDINWTYFGELFLVTLQGAYFLTLQPSSLFQATPMVCLCFLGQDMVSQIPKEYVLRGLLSRFPVNYYFF